MGRRSARVCGVTQTLYASRPFRIAGATGRFRRWPMTWAASPDKATPGERVARRRVRSASRCD
jgi:hypothetical protein